MCNRKILWAPGNGFVTVVPEVSRADPTKPQQRLQCLGSSPPFPGLLHFRKGEQERASSKANCRSLANTTLMAWAKWSPDFNLPGSETKMARVSKTRFLPLQPQHQNSALGLCPKTLRHETGELVPKSGDLSGTKETSGLRATILPQPV